MLPNCAQHPVTVTLISAVHNKLVLRGPRYEECDFKSYLQQRRGVMRLKTGRVMWMLVSSMGPNAKPVKLVRGLGQGEREGSGYRATVPPCLAVVERCLR